VNHFIPTIFYESDFAMPSLRDGFFLSNVFRVFAFDGSKACKSMVGTSLVRLVAWLRKRFSNVPTVTFNSNDLLFEILNLWMGHG